MSADLILCKKTLTEEDVDHLKSFIRYEYRYSLYLDDLPSATVTWDFIGDTKEKLYDYFDGIKVGEYFPEDDTAIIYNHWDITITYHNTLDDQSRIVGFDVMPLSMNEDENRRRYDEHEGSPEQNAWLEPGQTI